MDEKLFVFQWHVTDFCGNRCAHCYIKKFNKRNVSIEEAEGIIDDIKACCDELGAKSVLSITGGDPLAHPGIWEILERAKILNGHTGLLGNPELLNEKIVGRLIDAGVSRYQVSLDGMQKTHDTIRSRGSFKRTMASIELLARMGLSVTVMSTVSNMNYLEMAEVMKSAYGAGAKRWAFARWTPEEGDCGIAPSEYLGFLNWIIEAHKPFTQKGTDFPMKEPLMVPALAQLEASDCVIGGCGLGSSLLSILPDNTVMGCRRYADSVLGKWEKKGDLLDFFLFHPKMDEYRKIRQIEGCRDCKFVYQCRGCRAAAFASTGSIFGRDPQCFIEE